MSPTITTPRSMRRSLSCHRKKHERVRELRRNRTDKLDRLRLSRLYLSAESVSATCGFVKKLGMKKAPDNTAGGLRECASATRCWCDARRGVWYARRVPANQHGAQPHSCFAKRPASRGA